MNTADLLGGPLGHAVGLALLHALWQGTIVAIVLAAILTLSSRRSAAFRYGLSCAALAIVFALAVITGVRSYNPGPAVTASPAVTAVADASAVDDAVLIAASSTPRSWHDTWLATISTLLAHIPQIVVLWFLGVLVLTLRLAASWTRTRALATRGAVTADETWQLMAARLSQALGLRRPVRLVVSGGVDVPSVVGWLKPAILLPVSSLTGLTSEQLEMVLAHEVAHIRRHDFLINAMQSVVETLLFYHPAVWWLSRQIRIERENCCDDLAVSVCGDAILYARALAQLEELRTSPLLAIAANGGSLLDRVRRLVGAHSDRSLFSSGWTAAAAMASFVALLTLTTAPILAERQTPPPAPPAKPAVAHVDVRAPKPATEPTPEPDELDVDVDAVVPVPALPPEPPEPPDLSVVLSSVAPRVRVRPRALQSPVRHGYMVAPTAQAVVEGVTGALVWDVDNEDQSSSPTPPGKLSVDELIALRVQGVTPEYIQEMRSIGFGKLSIREIIALRSQGITPDEIGKMRSTGLGDLSAHDIVALHVQGVTPDYISAMRTAGVNIKTANEAVSLRVQGVTVDFVRSLAVAGYEHLTVHDLVRLATSGVNADFVREMSKYKK